MSGHWNGNCVTKSDTLYLAAKYFKFVVVGFCLGLVVSIKSFGGSAPVQVERVVQNGPPAEAQPLSHSKRRVRNRRLARRRPELDGTLVENNERDLLIRD